MADTIITALRDYLLTCPLMTDGKINVDYLPEKGVEYSIDTTPATEIIKQYMDGSTVRQYLFVVRSVNSYGTDALQNISNSGFYEKLTEWLDEQTTLRHFPALPTGRQPQKIEALSTGYLFAGGPNTGKYQIQCRLQYLQKRSILK